MERYLGNTINMNYALQTIEIHYSDIGCISGDIQQDKKSPRQELSA